MEKEVTTFVVEHMEPYLFEWCLHEYKAMKAYLLGFNARLLITNSQVIFNYDGKQREENQKYLKELQLDFSQHPERFQLISQSVQEIYTKFEGETCMLDMRGKQELNRDQNWNYVVFGGILGDHPPRDRPAPIRQYFPKIRHLGPLQLSTDTAVLVTRLILMNGMKLAQIPMVQEPTIKGKNNKGEKTTVQMEGFSYVSQQLDIQKGILKEGLNKKEKNEVYMSQGVRNLLLSQDLDPNLLM